MKLGLVGVRADRRGLAAQCETFAKHLNPERMLGIDMFAEELSPYENDWTTYPQEPELLVVKRCDITEDLAKKWMKGLDVLLGAETYYHDEFFTWARELGIRTYLQTNVEFHGWERWPKPRPDVFICPTTWMMDKILGAVLLPCPVDREKFPFRLRTSAEHFVHPAGHRAIADRAGTRMVMASVRNMREVRLTIRTQSDIGMDMRGRRRGEVVTVEHINFPDPRSLYEDADVIVLPRRYGGQCLTVNEALSSGCPVIMLDREPENQWDGVVTIPCRVRRHMHVQFGSIDWYDGSVSSLTNTMSQLRNQPGWVEDLSRMADKQATKISWDSLLGEWQDLLSCR